MLLVVFREVYVREWIKLVGSVICFILCPDLLSVHWTKYFQHAITITQSYPTKVLTISAWTDIVECKGITNTAGQSFDGRTSWKNVIPNYVIVMRLLSKNEITSLFSRRFKRLKRRSLFLSYRFSQIMFDILM